MVSNQTYFLGEGFQGKFFGVEVNVFVGVLGRNGAWVWLFSGLVVVDCVEMVVCGKGVFGGAVFMQEFWVYFWDRSLVLPLGTNRNDRTGISAGWGKVVHPQPSRG
jgi:hypothetical protein